MSMLTTARAYLQWAVYIELHGSRVRKMYMLGRNNGKSEHPSKSQGRGPEYTKEETMTRPKKTTCDWAERRQLKDVGFADRNTEGHQSNRGTPSTGLIRALVPVTGLPNTMPFYADRCSV